MTNNNNHSPLWVEDCGDASCDLNGIDHFHHLGASDGYAVVSVKFIDDETFDEYCLWKEGKKREWKESVLERRNG